MSQVLIAIVGDDEPVRDATKAVVRSLGYHASTFASVDAFLKSEQVHDTSCLITDVQMPGLSGIDLQDRLIVRAWILEPSATGLCKPDLHVFAKLFEDCLKRGLEAQAFSGREIGSDDDVLDFLVGHFVDVDLTRQPAS
jgi:Response regulator receiver domain